MALTDKLTAIADAIRGKTGKTDGLTLDQMPGEIAGIQAGGASEQELLTKMLSLDWPTGDMVVSNVSIGASVMSGRKITSLNLNNCTVGGNAFQGTLCETIEITNSNLGGSGHFTNCQNLTSATLRNTTVGGDTTFYNCKKLSFVDMGELGLRLGSSFANGCTNLKTLILRRTDQIAYIGNANAFNGTPLAANGTGGTVYVPAALIEQYQQASNWSALYAAGNCNFVAIEGSEYE